MIPDLFPRCEKIGLGTSRSKTVARPELLREVFQCELAADLQVKLSAASMD